MNDGIRVTSHRQFSTQHSSFRAILFDAVGTLIRPEPSVAGAYALAGRRHGVELAEDEIERRFCAAFARQEEIDRVCFGGQTDPSREVERWRQIVIEVFGVSREADRIFDDLWEHFAAPAHWQLFDDVLDVWQGLATAGVTVGIASNFDDRLEGICRELPPLAGCREVFVSSRLGWRKPHANFFAAIAEALDIPADEMLLVGDDLVNDYRAATAAGWQAVLLDRTVKQPVAPPATHDTEIDEMSPVATIRTLAELLR